MRESGPLGGERGAFADQLGMPRGDFAGASLQFGHLNQPGLEEIDLTWAKITNVGAAGPVFWAL